MDDERFGELLSQAARRPARPADIALIRRRGLRRRRTAQATAAAAVIVLAGGLLTVVGEVLPDGLEVVLAPTPAPDPTLPTPAPDPTPTPEPAEPEPEPERVPEPDPEPEPAPAAPPAEEPPAQPPAFEDDSAAAGPQLSRGSSGSGTAGGTAGGGHDDVLMLPNYDGGATPDALMQARVIGDREQGCVWLLPESGEPIAGVWPPGYHARFEPLRIYDADGVEVGRQGQLLDVGGGQSPMVDPVPPHCRTGDRVWVVGSVRPSE